MSYRSGLMLGDNPSNDEIVDALDTIQGQGSVIAEVDSDGSAWCCTIVRFVNKLGPDASDEFGRMRWERVATVAQQEGICV